MIKTEQKGEYTHTYSDTFYICRVSSGEVCMGAYDVNPDVYEETGTPLDPSVIEMREALSVLGVQT